MIDAFSAGLPVIATDWHYNAELIDHGKTGFIYDPVQPEQLRKWMEYAISHPEEFHAMRFSCLNAVSAKAILKNLPAAMQNES